MFKFVKLDSVLNFVSSYVKENFDTPQILQWANQAYRRLEMPGIQYDLKTVCIPVENHKATLPNDVRKVVGIWFTQQPIPEQSYNIVVEVDNEDKSVILQQQLLLSSPWVNTFVPLSYKGQNRQAIIDEQLYCKDCGYGFSLDSSMKCLTLDIADGDVIIEYYAILKDDDCNILIPDDPTLQEGLSAWASHKAWEDLSDRRVEAARERSLYYMQLSQNLINRFRGKVHLMNVQPSLYEKFRQQRFETSGHWTYKRNPSIFRPNPNRY